MNHLIFGLMQISSPGYYLTWIFPSGKNCHAVVIPGFKCESYIMPHAYLKNIPIKSDFKRIAFMFLVLVLKGGSRLNFDRLRCVAYY